MMDQLPSQTELIDLELEIDWNLSNFQALLPSYNKHRSRIIHVYI